MSVMRSVTGAASDARVREWLPVGLRLVVAVVVGPAGVLKFLDYGSEVAAFTSYGVPAAEWVVPVVGVVELVAAAAIALGVACRFAALALVPVMVAAMALYAVVPSNAVALVGCVGVVALGAGKFAVWVPERNVANRVARLDSTGSK
jgi:uncharacterized membrane protein YphA (DoxX/SURF4 family)